MATRKKRRRQGGEKQPPGAGEDLSAGAPSTAGVSPRELTGSSPSAYFGGPITPADRARWKADLDRWLHLATLGGYWRLAVACDLADWYVPPFSPKGADDGTEGGHTKTAQILFAAASDAIKQHELPAHRNDREYDLNRSWTLVIPDLHGAWLVTAPDFVAWLVGKHQELPEYLVRFRPEELAAQAAAAEEQEEPAAAAPRPNRPALPRVSDFTPWLQLKYVTIVDAWCLWHGVDPEGLPVDLRRYLENEPPDVSSTDGGDPLIDTLRAVVPLWAGQHVYFSTDMLHMLEAARRAFDAGELPRSSSDEPECFRVPLPDFIVWATGRKFKAPDDGVAAWAAAQGLLSGAGAEGRSSPPAPQEAKRAISPPAPPPGPVVGEVLDEKATSWRPITQAEMDVMERDGGIALLIVGRDVRRSPAKTGQLQEMPLRALLAWAEHRGEWFDPQAAIPGAQSRESVLQALRRAREFIDGKRVLFQSTPTRPGERVRWKFDPPRTFRYTIVRPIAP